MFGLGKKKKKSTEKDKAQKEQREKEEKILQRDLSLVDDKILDDVPYKLTGDTK